MSAKPKRPLLERVNDGEATWQELGDAYEDAMRERDALAEALRDLLANEDVTIYASAIETVGGRFYFEGWAEKARAALAALEGKS